MQLFTCAEHDVMHYIRMDWECIVYLVLLCKQYWLFKAVSQMAASILNLAGVSLQNGGLKGRDVPSRLSWSVNRDVSYMAENRQKT